jgi:hypothetical protein
MWLVIGNAARRIVEVHKTTFNNQIVCRDLMERAKLVVVWTLGGVDENVVIHDNRPHVGF